MDYVIRDFPQTIPDLQNKTEFPVITYGSLVPTVYPQIQAPVSPTTSQKGKATSSSSTKKSSKSKKKTNILEGLVILENDNSPTV